MFAMDIICYNLFTHVTMRCFSYEEHRLLWLYDSETADPISIEHVLYSLLTKAGYGTMANNSPSDRWEIISFP